MRGRTFDTCRDATGWNSLLTAFPAPRSVGAGRSPATWCSPLHDLACGRESFPVDARCVSSESGSASGKPCLSEGRAKRTRCKRRTVNGRPRSTPKSGDPDPSPRRSAADPTRNRASIDTSGRTGPDQPRPGVPRTHAAPCNSMRSLDVLRKCRLQAAICRFVIKLWAGLADALRASPHRAGQFVHGLHGLALPAYTQGHAARASRVRDDRA